jgi:hypothetical protein
MKPVVIMYRDSGGVYGLATWSLPGSVGAFLTGRVPASFLLATPTVITFEGLPDGTVLTTQYPGITFSDAIILTAGISLDEFEFPPKSGNSVASDNGGPMGITFANPVTSFGGYFTYAEPLVLAAFDSTSKQVASVASLFSNNEALSGDLGSSPNEFLLVSFASGISSVKITGDPGGASFGLDDAAFTTGASAIPEPSCMRLGLAGGAVLLFIWRRRCE